MFFFFFVLSTLTSMILIHYPTLTIALIALIWLVHFLRRFAAIYFRVSKRLAVKSPLQFRIQIALWHTHTHCPIHFHLFDLVPFEALPNPSLCRTRPPANLRCSSFFVILIRQTTFCASFSAFALINLLTLSAVFLFLFLSRLAHVALYRSLQLARFLVTAFGPA